MATDDDIRKIRELGESLIALGHRLRALKPLPGDITLLVEFAAALGETLDDINATLDEADRRASLPEDRPPS